jgi:hypothetical protein
MVSTGQYTALDAATKFEIAKQLQNKHQQQ